MNLTITGIEQIVFTTQFGFDDVRCPAAILASGFTRPTCSVSSRPVQIR